MKNKDKKEIFWLNVITFLDSCNIPNKTQINHFNVTLSVLNENYVSIPQKIKNRLTSLYNDYVFNYIDKATIINEMLNYSEKM
jgi:hypothetical protein